MINGVIVSYLMNYTALFDTLKVNTNPSMAI